MAETNAEFDPLVDELPSRYVVGIDLGTTNSAVTYVDTEETPWQIRVFSVPQLVAPGETEALESLPSFHYQPTRAEQEQGVLKLPWDANNETAVGVYARDLGSRTAGRVVSSAKSWLCHSGVDRTADLLPWQGADDVDRLSPVQVSARYLKHIREAWNYRFSEHRLEDQDVVITIPASFDEIARELTIQAAASAGLPRVVLIEEPQAAFYAWVYKHQDDWEPLVSPGQRILVCDIGGGTSDFTLIRVKKSAAENETDAKIQFHRVAVGDHLILGGDNLDLAIAKFVEPKLAQSGTLTPKQWDMLLNRCRRVKEELLSEDAPDLVTINLPGTGSKLIGAGIQTEVKRDEIHKLLIDGFLPEVEISEKPSKQQSGFREFGLPFASDAAISKYLGRFLLAHQETGTDHDSEHPARPDIVLFNGGFFASPQLRQRLIGLVEKWFAQSEDWSPQILDNDRLDLAVARGASYYGMVRRGAGVRIAASLARSYYVSVQNGDDENVAVCLVPGNAEPGQEVTLDRPFLLTISQPVEFPLLISSTRLTDRPGDVVPIDLEQMRAIPPIRTVLKSRRRSESGEIAVNLFVRLTEIGTIDLWCKELDFDRSWRLQFDIRSATQTDVDVHQSDGESEGVLDEATWHDCQTALGGVFSVDGKEQPGQLNKSLSEILDADRFQWPMSLLRRIWDALMELEPGRRKSPAHEARWLNLLGFALRPGYGFAVDDWRVSETWRTVRDRLVHRGGNISTESLILWRRLAGGLSSGQQLAIAQPFLAAIRAMHRQSTTGKASGGAMKPEETIEVWRLLGSLELLSKTLKVELGNMLVDLIPKRRFTKVREPMVWALGRLGQRVPVYGPLNTIVSSDVALKWAGVIQRQKETSNIDHLAVMQLSRKTGDRYRDISESDQSDVVDWLKQRSAPKHLQNLVRDVGELDQDEQGLVFGESLPKGLRIQ